MKSLPLSVLARVLGSGPVEGFDTNITGVSTDTRTIKPGDCFFALAGGNFDGHNFVREALAKGAVCAVVQRPVEGTGAAPILRVPDTVQALGDLAREYRRMSPFKVVAITGSVGKTTTRQITHHVLSRHFRVHQASKSFNNNIGLPLTLLGADAETQIVVAELGANHPGEIACLTRIAQPDVALVTNAHPAHLEGFGDLATIIREKLSIAEGLSADGVLIINGDIEPLVKAARSSAIARGEGILPLLLRDEGVLPSNRRQDAGATQGRDARATRGQDAHDTKRRAFRTFGKSLGADYCVEQIACEALHSTFTIGTTQIRLPLPGPGNVENALAAWAICDQFGVTTDAFAEAVATLGGVSMRAEALQIGRLTVLNDCYNANPASMKNALAMLHNLRPANGAGRKRRLVFICGEMAELGPQTQTLHEDLGRAVAEAGVDLLVTVGTPPRTTARAAAESARHDLQTRSFDDTVSVCGHMQEFLQEDDILLVKGSRTARLERVVEALIKDYG